LKCPAKEGEKSADPFAKVKGTRVEKRKKRDEKTP